MSQDASLSTIMTCEIYCDTSYNNINIKVFNDGAFTFPLPSFKILKQDYLSGAGSAPCSGEHPPLVGQIEGANPNPWGYNIVYKLCMF